MNARKRFNAKSLAWTSRLQLATASNYWSSNSTRAIKWTRRKTSMEATSAKKKATKA